MNFVSGGTEAWTKHRKNTEHYKYKYRFVMCTHVKDVDGAEWKKEINVWETENHADGTWACINMLVLYSVTKHMKWLVFTWIY